MHTLLWPAADSLVLVMRRVQARDGLTWIAAPLGDSRVRRSKELDSLVEIPGDLLDKVAAFFGKS